MLLDLDGQVSSLCGKCARVVGVGVCNILMAAVAVLKGAMHRVAHAPRRGLCRLVCGRGAVHGVRGVVRLLLDRAHDGDEEDERREGNELSRRAAHGEMLLLLLRPQDEGSPPSEAAIDDGEAAGDSGGGGQGGG